MNTKIFFILFNCLLLLSCGNNSNNENVKLEGKEQMDSMVEALENAGNMDSILATQGDVSEMPDSTASGEMEEDTMYDSKPVEVQVH